MLIKLFDLFNAKFSFWKQQLWYHLTYSWEDKGIHNFPKNICPKVNVSVRLEFELTHYDFVVQRLNHYTKKTPTCNTWYHKTLGVIVKTLECGIVAVEFEIQLHYYVHFPTNTVGG